VKHLSADSQNTSVVCDTVTPFLFHQAPATSCLKFVEYLYNLLVLRGSRASIPLADSKLDLKQWIKQRAKMNFKKILW
jgi:hypothetical protein